MLFYHERQWNVPPNFHFSSSIKLLINWEAVDIKTKTICLRVSFRNVHAVWTEDHALAWHLEERFRQDSAAWALDKCLAWDKLENQLPNFLSEIIDCPCTLAQARADTGRFHVSGKGNM